MLRQKQCGGVTHLTQAFFGHGEHAELVYCTKAIFERAYHAKAGVGIALEIQHGIHDVFQHTRPGQRPILGDVADQNHGHC